jgi:hypothetical protein
VGCRVIVQGISTLHTRTPAVPGDLKSWHYGLTHFVGANVPRLKGLRPLDVIYIVADVSLASNQGREIERTFVGHPTCVRRHLHGGITFGGNFNHGELFRQVKYLGTAVRFHVTRCCNN